MNNTLPKPSTKKQITPLKLRFSFSEENTKSTWIKDDPFTSHFMNAMSLTFPDGERFFMDAVRSFKNEIKDEAIQKDIQGFIYQEAFHGNAHENFNKFLKDQGYPVEKLTYLVKVLLKKIQEVCDSQKHLDTVPLAITCGLEHITAILGNLLLTNHGLTNKMDKNMQTLWLWHALEELEHKAVAYDVYSTVQQNYFERIFFFLVGTVAFLLAIHAFQFILLEKDNMNTLKTWVVGLNRLYGIGGYVSSTIPTWVTYLRPGFHPWKEQDNSFLIGPWKNIITENNNTNA